MSEKKPAAEWVKEWEARGAIFHNYHGFGGDHYGLNAEEMERFNTVLMSKEELEAKAMLCSQSNLQTAKEQASDE